MKKPASLFILALAVLVIPFFRVTEQPVPERDGSPYSEIGKLYLWEGRGMAEDGAVKACGVYYAPFDDAARPADGTVVVDGSVRGLGNADRGKWTMIEYPLQGGGNRVAWIMTPEDENDDFNTFPNENRPCRLTRDCDLTDDPFGMAGTVLTLKEGDIVIALGVIRPAEEMYGLGMAGARAEEAASGGWTYVQTEIGGQTAWLFIPSDALAPEILWSADENGVLTVREGVTRIGGEYMGAFLDEDGVLRRILLPLTKDEIAISGLNDGYNIPEGLRAIVFPSTLRALGAQAVNGGSYEYIYLPRLPECSTWEPFSSVRTKKLILGPDFRDIDVIADNVYFSIEGFEAADGSPVYVSVDGVLFSADGKTLIKYPNARPAEHYTVPAGTEEIADGAFDYGGAGIPLKTISLPVGLKRIGDRAFSGCGRLISLAVPLTVTELSENAFSGCVSLERLSLPPGLNAVFDTHHIEYGDFTVYNGDNGSTLPRPTVDPYLRIYEEYEQDNGDGAEEEEPEAAGFLPRAPDRHSGISLAHPHFSYWSCLKRLKAFL